MKLFNKDNTQPKEKSDKTLMEKAWDLQNRIEARQKRFGKGKSTRKSI